MVGRRGIIISLLLMACVISVSAQAAFDFSEATPEAGTDIQSGDSIVLTFTRAVDCTSAFSAITIEPAVVPLGVDCDDATVTLNLEGELDATQDYVVSIGAGLRAANGDELGREVTLTYPASYALRVVEALPRPDTVGVGGLTPVTVVFDRPVIPLTIGQDMDDFAAPFSLFPPVEGTGEWVNTFIYTFEPKTALVPGTTYVVEVDPELTGVDGAVQSRPYTWSFATSNPRITRLRPLADLGGGVQPSARISMAFSTGMKRESVEAAFSLTPAEGGDPVPGTFEWPEGDWLMVFQPDEFLESGTTYIASLDTALVGDALGGVPLEGQSEWQFGTLPHPDLIETSPSDGAEVRSYNGFSLEFNTFMDSESINERLTIEPEPEFLSGFRSGMIYRASFPATGSTTYTVRIEPGIKDLYGNVYDEPIEFTYTTLPYAPSFDLRVPFGPVGFYNGSGDYTGMFVRHRNVETIGVQVYTITPRQFIELAMGSTRRGDEEVNLFNYEPESETLLHSWTVDVDNILDTSVPTLFTLGPGSACGDLEPALNLGDIVTVAGEDPVSAVQTAGGTGTAFQLFPGFEVAIIGGPFCAADETIWWQVQVDEAQAWVAEDDLAFVASTQSGEIAVTDATGESLRPGFYHLQLRMQNPFDSDYTRGHNMMVLTANLTLKISFDGLTVWATDVASGEPIASAPVTVFNDEAEIIAAGVTGADGLLTVPLDDVENLTRDRYAALLNTDDHVSIGLTNWADGIDPGMFDLSTAFSQQDYAGTVYLDRQIYRPGETVYYRGVIRQKDDMTFSVPRTTNQVLVSYNDGVEGYLDIVRLTPFGTFSGQFTLSENAPPGGFYDISVEAWPGGERDEDEERLVALFENFSVAEFRLPEYSVNVEPAERDIAAGDTAQIAVTGEYYFGGAVSGATVEYEVIASPFAFVYTGEDFYRFYNSYWDDPDVERMRAREVADGIRRETGPDGVAVLELDADLGEFPGSQTFTVEATLRDESNQTVSAATRVNVHAGAYYIGTRTESSIGRTGEEATVDAILVDWDSTGIPEQVLEVEVFQREWFSVQKRDPVTGRTSWEYEIEDTFVTEGEATTGTNGRTAYTFTPEAGGLHVVMFTTRDEQGNAIQGQARLYVTSREYVSWRVPNNNRIELIADRDEYNVGDTAQIMLTSPFQGEATALITVERADIIEHDVITVDSNSYVYELPIAEDFAPNVFVSVMIVKGTDANNPVPAFRMGMIQLPVTIDTKRLNIDFEYDDSVTYQPGDTVEYTVRVSDYAGEPVVAEVGVALTDEASLDIFPPVYMRSDWLLSQFYREQGIAIRTSTPLTINTEQITQQILDAVKGGGGGGGGGGLPSQFDLREDFISTAYWNATVITGRDGTATFEVELPDNLTNWVLTGYAITNDPTASFRLGQDDTNTRSTLPLLIRPATPRFMVVGDQLELGAIVNNNTDEAQSIAVTLRAEGVTLEDAVTQNVIVEAGGRVRVDWTATADNVPAAELIFTVENEDGSLTDASRPTLGQGDDQLIPIYRYDAPETVGTGGRLQSGDTRVETITLPAFEILEGELAIEVQPSLAATTVDSLSYLRNFPDQCVEQTVSRFLPNIIVYRALNDLGLADETLRANLDEAVDFALEKLLAEQKVDGGWGWYLREESHPLTTAYTLIALVEAVEQGYFIDNDVIAGAIGYLQGELLNDPGLDRPAWQLNRQAFILYALAYAGEPDVARTANLFEQRERLNLDARAYVALTLHIIDPDDRTRTDEIVNDFAAAAVTNANGIHWVEQTRDYWNWSTNTRTTALVLMTMVKLEPENELLPAAVRWLVTMRERNSWSTTQETAWAVMAFTDWMTATGELQPDYSYQVDFNGEELLPETAATPDDVLETIELTVEISDLLTDTANELTFDRTTGEGALYYTAYLNTLLPVPEVEPLDNGLIIERRYTLQNDDDLTSIDSARIGDVVQSRLTIIVPEPVYYVNIEDPLPAGAEAIDPNLATSERIGVRPSFERVDQARGWGWWWFSNIEFRDEKVVLSTSYLPAGVYEFVYNVRLTTVGVYNVIPPTGQEFYFPEVYGRGAGMLFTVLPEDSDAN
jgi:alpha-2-macroglobulin